MIGLVAGAPGYALAGAPTAVAVAPSFTAAPPGTGEFDCLLDLPPLTPGCARLYLCRHGQTENNRLKIVQGARVDPSINENGHEQARRLGVAVTRLTQQSSSGSGVVPRLVVHSKLRRARETAELLASTVASQATSGDRPALKVCGEVPFIGEVDFGDLEGKDVNDLRKDMTATIASWSIGNVDARTGGGGESGRQVLERAVLALDQLGTMAASSSPTSSLIAVSHSAYLRILLSVVKGSPLLESAAWKLQNGSINVVDVNVEGKRTVLSSSSGLFGGKLVGGLRGDNGLELEMPEAHLIRKNEVRHLQGMNM